MDELGRTIANVCTICPGGVVCFFPSYEYERSVYNRWEESGQLATIIRKKQVLPPSGSTLGGTHWVVHTGWYTLGGTHWVVHTGWYTLGGTHWVVHTGWYTLGGTHWVVHTGWYTLGGTHWVVHTGWYTLGGDNSSAGTCGTVSSQVFREPKLSSQVDQVLHQYGRCIEVEPFISA